MEELIPNSSIEPVTLAAEPLSFPSPLSSPLPEASSPILITLLPSPLSPTLLPSPLSPTLPAPPVLTTLSPFPPSFSLIPSFVVPTVYSEPTQPQKSSQISNKPKASSKPRSTARITSTWNEYDTVLPITSTYSSISLSSTGSPTKPLHSIDPFVAVDGTELDAKATHAATKKKGKGGVIGGVIGGLSAAIILGLLLFFFLKWRRKGRYLDSKRSSFDSDANGIDANKDVLPVSTVPYNPVETPPKVEGQSMYQGDGFPSRYQKYNMDREPALAPTAVNPHVRAKFTSPSRSITPYEEYSSPMNRSPVNRYSSPVNRSPVHRYSSPINRSPVNRSPSSRGPSPISNPSPKQMPTNYSVNRPSFYQHQGSHLKPNYNPYFQQQLYPSYQHFRDPYSAAAIPRTTPSFHKPPPFHPSFDRRRGPPPQHMRRPHPHRFANEYSPYPDVYGQFGMGSPEEIPPPNLGLSRSHTFSGSMPSHRPINRSRSVSITPPDHQNYPDNFIHPIVEVPSAPSTPLPDSSWGPGVFMKRASNSPLPIPPRPATADGNMGRRPRSMMNLTTLASGLDALNAQGHARRPVMSWAAEAEKARQSLKIRNVDEDIDSINLSVPETESKDNSGRESMVDEVPANNKNIATNF